MKFIWYANNCTDVLFAENIENIRSFARKSVWKTTDVIKTMTMCVINWPETRSTNVFWHSTYLTKNYRCQLINQYKSHYNSRLFFFSICYRWNLHLFDVLIFSCPTFFARQQLLHLYNEYYCDGYERNFFFLVQDELAQRIFSVVVCLLEERDLKLVHRHHIYLLYAQFVASDIQIAIAHHHNTHTHTHNDIGHDVLLDLLLCSIWHGNCNQCNAIWLSNRKVYVQNS